jgi:protein-S-isoprenylcysteine O-methyltransferase Ste14
MKLHIPPNYFYLGLLLSVVLYLLFPRFNTIPFPYNLVGVPVLTAGFYIVIGSWKIFMHHGTSESYDEAATTLVTDSLYRYSRHPMYVGAVLASIGLCITLQGNLLSFAGPIFIFLVLNFVFIPYEEEQMLEKFGDAYRDYMHRVRKWI